MAAIAASFTIMHAFWSVAPAFAPSIARPVTSTIVAAPVAKRASTGSPGTLSTSTRTITEVAPDERRGRLPAPQFARFIFGNVEHLADVGTAGFEHVAPPAHDERRPRHFPFPDAPELRRIDERLRHVPFPEEYVGTAGGQRFPRSIEVVDDHKAHRARFPATLGRVDDRYEVRPGPVAADRDSPVADVAYVVEVASARDMDAPDER
jgi:hypothetical protein